MFCATSAKIKSMHSAVHIRSQNMVHEKNNATLRKYGYTAVNNSNWRLNKIRVKITIKH